uniref:Transmembrane protein n=1 Tax=Caenorhabditis japonica TaxID=281687 RepID=A0A8R1IF08_CAEJA
MKVINCFDVHDHKRSLVGTQIFIVLFSFFFFFFSSIHEMMERRRKKTKKKNTTGPTDSFSVSCIFEDGDGKEDVVFVSKTTKKALVSLHFHFPFFSTIRSGVL